MKRLLIFSLLLLATSAYAGPMAEGIMFDIRLSQRDSASGKQILIAQDTVEFLKGIRTSSYYHAFSVEIEVNTVDSAACSFSVTTTTLGPSSSNRSRIFTAEYGLPARLSDITAKPGAVYELAVIPLMPTITDTSDCPYLVSDFAITPSANLDLYYVQGTMGDYFLPGVKGMVESIYEQAKRLFGFTLPGKYHLFLCPCKVREAIWDDRFGLSTNPLRSTAHVVLTKEWNAADPFPVIQTALLRSWGDAPPPLVDGLASFYTLSLFDMKEMVPKRSYLPLDSLLTTASYLRAEPTTADRSAASFCEFLTRAYGIDKVGDLYQAASDLTLRAEVVRIFGKPLPELEKDWLHWVDTTTITPPELVTAAEMAEAMFNYDRMLRLCRSLDKAAATRTDTARALDLLSRATFSTGNYRDAIEIQRRLNNIKLDVPRFWTSLGSYQLMISQDTADAFSAFRTALQLDSTNTIPIFNMAFTLANLGDTNRAITTLLPICQSGATTFPEANILLADLLRESGRKDRDPVPLYQNAIAHLEQSLQMNRSPYVMGWIGRGYLGLGDTENSLNYLWTALRLETRPFYEGMIRLWLGNLMDELGEREAAKEQYGAVIANNSAIYHKALAERYMKTPYSTKPH